MRVVLFGAGGPFSVRALDVLAARVTLVAVVIPTLVAPGGPRATKRCLEQWWARRPFLARAHHLGVPVLTHRPGSTTGVDSALGGLRPDVGCIAAFPHHLAASTLHVPRQGVVNLHASLLPRHRGPAPLFWTYFHDDAETGVTVHWVDEGLDTGDIVYQERVPLGRGRPAREVYAELADRGAALLVQSVEAIAGGRAPRDPQDESQASREPVPRPGTWTIDFPTWGAALPGRRGRDVAPLPARRHTAPARRGSGLRPRGA